MLNAKKKLFLPLILAGLILAIVFKLQAQKPPAGIEIHPSNFDLAVTPGNSQKGSIYLKNITKNTFRIKVDRRNFTALGEEGQVNLTPEETSFSLAPWLKITPQTVTVRPNEEVKFDFIITPPENAEPGGHFGSIVFATVPGSTDNTGAAVSQEVASIFLVRIPGIVNEQATIESFKTGRPFYEFGPVNFEARLKNEGGVHLKPAGVITLTGWLGQKKYAGVEGLNVLPGAIRKLRAELPDTWLFGHYSANLDITYGSANSHLYATTDFWAFPLRAIAVGLAVIVVLFLLRKRLWKAIRVLIRGK